MGPGDIVASRFRIEAIAGTGGMGTVYRASDLVAGGAVALKTLARIGERDAARFAREAAVLAELVHPGIVRYVAHGLTAEHEHYIVMEWIDGETLHERLARGRLAPEQALALARAVADAIGAAHRRGVVHRDLKPMNLLLPGGELARVKVLDFGIARHIAAAGLLTNTGTVVGTPGYMAPEQVRGETAIDARSDVFALGCVLYRGLTGVSAFGGDQGLAVLAKILVEDVAPPSTLVAGIAPAVDALVLALLAKDPAARPADGRAVVAAIDALDRAAGAVAVEVGATAATAASTATAETIAGVITGAEQRLVSLVLATAPIAAPADRMATIATAYGGRLERFADGALLVLFAHAEVATDHAVRAARCALALRDAAPALALVVGSGKASGDSGEVIDRAGALLRGVASGQIAVDDATVRLLDERFVIAARGEQTFLRALRDAHEPARTLLGKTTPIVGRDRELAMLESVWTECADERVARAVLVTAPPGGGKSRLRQELVRRVLQRDERAELLTGRGDSLRAGSPFAIVAEAIRGAAGVREGDELDVQRAALRARVERAIAGPDRDRVAHLLGEIAGVAFPTDASEALRAARADAVVRGDAMRTAWVDWLAAECARAPVLLVLEDLHWGDRPSVELVDVALRELAHAPLLVLALARAEVHDAFPRLWSERALTEVRLPQLTHKASERLASELLGPAVDAATIARIVDRSNGNAFFLEELIRAVAEGRGDTLPDSILSMLQLRLDTLGGDVKRALRAASVFGETFWHGGVARLLDHDPRDALDALVQRELVARVAVSRLPGETEYAFRHDLVREAAYAMLNADDRVLAHGAAGDWLVAHGHTDAVELAHHYTLGRQPQRAAELYARAAEQALAGHDNAAALAHIARGLASSPAPEVAARLCLMRAQGHNWIGEHVPAIEAATAAREGFVAGTARWFQASDELFYAFGRLGEIGRAIATLHDLTTTVAEPNAVVDQLRSVARAAIVMFRFGPPDIGAALVHRVEALAAPITADLSTEQRLHTLRALVARARGDAARCLAEHEAAERACERTHNLRELAFTHLSHGGVYTELGAPELGLPLLERGIAVADRIGATTILPLLWFSRALCELELGRHADAAAHARQALALCTKSDRAAAGLSHWVIARAALAAGDLATAETELAAAREWLAPFPDYDTFSLATAARIAVRRGDIAYARTAATAAHARMRAQDGFQDGEAFIRLVEIEVLEAAGEEAAAHEAAVTAIARLAARAARIDEPWRSRFLAKSDHAATLARAPR